MRLARSFPSYPGLLTLLVLAGCATSAPPATEGTASPTGTAPSSGVEPPSAPTFDLDTPLPTDDAVRIGQLDNGLTYYIRRNTEPANRAELRLAVNAGSILEADDQQGLAHFLEHMLFNGTQRFEEQALVDFLESIGMRFGPDVNAYTSFDETVYDLTVPTDSAALVDRAFDVLEDWAAYATLDSTEVVAERGVIIEEWRARDQNAGGRIRAQILPVLLGGSRYSQRLPIGDTLVVRGATPTLLRRYYEDWYRPDLMAIVAVGDFDVDTVEAHITSRFATLPSRPAPPARPTYDIPLSDTTRYAVITDPEYPVTSVDVSFRRPASTVAEVGDYRAQLVRGLFRGMLNARLAEQARTGTAAFLGASAYEGGLARPLATYGLQGRVEEDSLLTGLAALLTEVERVRQHGFTPTELMRQRRAVLRAYERALLEAENTPSARYAAEYVRHFLEDEPIPGIAYEAALTEDLLPRITTDDVNRLADQLLTDAGRAVIVTMPEKEGLVPPTEADLAAVFARVQRTPVAPYEDTVTDLPLLAEIPAPAAVTSTQQIDTLGVTQLTLANGIQVFMKPTTFREDEVRMTASSPGGSSLASDEDAFEASLAAQLVAQSGVGAFDRTALTKRLAGQAVSVTPTIGPLSEGFQGSAAPADLETLFQLVHLYATAPRLDSAAVSVFTNQFRAFLTNRSAAPESALQDTVLATLYGDELRYQLPTLADLEMLDARVADRFYRDRFADLGDFAFTFVGNFNPDTLTALAQHYLGTLPTTGRTETWRDIAPALPGGVVEKTIYRGLADRSTVLMLFYGDLPFDRVSRHRLRTLSTVLSTRLREVLREDLGGVYGVNVGATPAGEPREVYQLTISFTCDPARVDELRAAILDEVRQLQAEGPTADDLAKVTEQQRRGRETALETNAFWTSVLDFYATTPREDLLDILRYNDLIDSVTVSDVQQMAQRVLNLDQYIQAVLLPEEMGQ
ncbi:MAG: insulinase family protein [Bacteroidota bacterium]